MPAFRPFGIATDLIHMIQEFVKNYAGVHERATCQVAWNQGNSAELNFRRRCHC